MYKWQFGVIQNRHILDFRFIDKIEFVFQMEFIKSDKPEIMTIKEKSF